MQASVRVHQVAVDDPDLVRLVAEQKHELSMRYVGNPGHGHPQPPLHPAAVHLLARDGADAVGCVAVQPLSHTAPDAAEEVGEVKRLYVVPAARGRGVSRILMGALEQAARESGYARLQLETGLRQPEALALYRGLGYTEVPPYGYYKDSPESVCFTKSL